MKKQKELEYKEIGFNDIIRYKVLHENYGRAEFEFCPQFIRGKLKKLFITARQQERKDSGCWVIDFEKQDYKKCTTLSFEAWTHKGIEAPRAWHESWCKEHKALCHRVYVPTKTSSFMFRLHFGDSIQIHFE